MAIEDMTLIHKLASFIYISPWIFTFVYIVTQTSFSNSCGWHCYIFLRVNITIPPLATEPPTCYVFRISLCRNVYDPLCFRPSTVCLSQLGGGQVPSSQDDRKPTAECQTRSGSSGEFKLMRNEYLWKRSTVIVDYREGYRRYLSSQVKGSFHNHHSGQGLCHPAAPPSRPSMEVGKRSAA